MDICFVLWELCLLHEAQSHDSMWFFNIQLETAAEAQRILMEATGDSEPQKPQKLKKKKKKTRSAHPARNHITNGTATNGKPCSRHTRPKSADSEKIPGMEPLDHYKLNLAEMPFVAGKVSSTCSPKQV